MTSVWRLTLLTATATALLAPPATAQTTLTVDPADKSAYASINDAIWASESGDVIEVTAGTYTECIEPFGKSLTIVGAGPANTSVDSAGSCESTVGIWYGESLVVQDMAISNSAGRAAYNYYSTLTLENVRIADSGRSELYGGAVYQDGGTTHIVDSTLEDNLGYFGGAIAVSAYGTLNIEGSEFARNETSYGGGGAIYLYYANQLAIEDSTFEDNTTVGQGGAIYAYWETDVTVSNSSFSGHRSVHGGGTIELNWYGDLTLDGVHVEDSEAQSDGGVGYLYDAGDLTITDSVFTNNRSTYQMGGFAAYWLDNIEISGSTFTGNSAPDGAYSGALYFYDVNATVLSNNLFCGNSAGYGAAIATSLGDTEIYENNLFVENTAGVEGGAIYRYAGYDGVINNNTFAGNGAGSFGGAYLAYDSYAEFTNNAVVGTTTGNGIYAWTSESGAYSTLAHDGWWQNELVHAGGYFYVKAGEEGHIEDDPQFVAWSADGDCSNDDFHLQNGSPYRDAGDPKRLDPDGTRSDIGAYGGPNAKTDGAGKKGDTADTGLGADTADTADTAWTGETGDTGTIGDTSDGDDAKADCGCGVGTDGTSAPWALLALGALIGRRRRSRGTFGRVSSTRDVLLPRHRCPHP